MQITHDLSLSNAEKLFFYIKHHNLIARILVKCIFLITCTGFKQALLFKIVPIHRSVRIALRTILFYQAIIAACDKSFTSVAALVVSITFTVAITNTNCSKNDKNLHIIILHVKWSESTEERIPQKVMKRQTSFYIFQTQGVRKKIQSSTTVIY